MKNKKTMLVKIDWNKRKVLNPDLNSIVRNFIENNIDFELVLIDAENYIIDSHINAIVDRYIADLKKANAPLAVGYRSLCEFIENLLKYLGYPSTIPDPSAIAIDVIAPNKRSFKAEIPSIALSEEKIQDLLHLGPDHVANVLSSEVIFDHVLCPFYLFLFKNDLLNDDVYCDLIDYTFGIH